MSSAAALVSGLFPMPGRAVAAAEHVLAHAGSAHAQLLAAAAADEPSLRPLLLEPLATYLRSRASAAAKRRWLDAPQLIAALHAIAPACPKLSEWDHSDECCGVVSASHALALGRAKLGNLALPLQLAADPNWCGTLELASNALGQLAFPGCPWSIVLVCRGGGQEDWLAERIVRATVGRRECRLELVGQDAAPLFELPRAQLVRLLAGSSRVVVKQLRLMHPTVWPRFVRAPLLGRSGIRFESVGGGGDGHGEQTGAIVAAMIRAVAHNSPSIYRELCAFIHAIRGFELPSAGAGFLQSFSQPVEPGVIGLNVLYSHAEEPLLSPLCFLCLGHELGHTKHYLIDDVVYARRLRFLENGREWTGTIARYGRPLRIRTLFQIPYVHLYEWSLLMDFAHRGFGHLPWSVDDQWRETGEEIAAEIDEAFERILASAQLTPLGLAAIEHLRKLRDDAAARWRKTPAQLSRTARRAPR